MEQMEVDWSFTGLESLRQHRSELSDPDVPGQSEGAEITNESREVLKIGVKQT